jgi:hypothetical protein
MELDESSDEELLAELRRRLKSTLTEYPDNWTSRALYNASVECLDDFEEMYDKFKAWGYGVPAPTR